MIPFSQTQTTWMGAAALACALLAAPAAAQTGGVRGRVVDEQNKPVVGASVVLTFLGPVHQEFPLTTDAKGEFIRLGMNSGAWKIVAAKEKLTGTIPSVTVRFGDVAKVADIVITPASPATKMSAKGIDDFNKKQKENEATFNEAKAALAAGRADDVLTKMSALIAALPDCGSCYALSGDAYVKKGDLAAAETAYKKAIELKPDLAAPYANLATIYNDQHKFDDAARMSAKANELLNAGGATGNAGVIYGQAVILWNQEKAEEAEPLLQKATELDPKMADAFYLLGMARVHLGKLKEAVAPLEQYLILDPTGKRVAEVKDMLKAIK